MTSSELHLLPSLLALTGLLVEERTRCHEREKVTHERFNVFTTLLRAGDEVRLHTRFLHCLLDPQGTHDCGGLFLGLFFDALAEHPPLSHGKSYQAFVLQPITLTSSCPLCVSAPSLCEGSSTRRGNGAAPCILQAASFQTPFKTVSAVVMFLRT